MSPITPGSLLAKGLGIDTNAHKRQVPDDLVDRAADAISPYDKFFEDDPTVQEWIREHLPSRRSIIPYFTGFFPFAKWIARYNTRWLTGDLIAGTTLALVMVPQGLSYALLGNLSPEYGIYTSFVGTALYWIFGTSKDIAIGVCMNHAPRWLDDAVVIIRNANFVYKATAVVSLLVGKTGDRVLEQHPEFTRDEIAKAHAFLCGCILLVFGLLKLDWLIEFIPHMAISAFVTGAAITITLSQLPTLLGIAGINTRGPAYQVAIDFLRGLKGVKLDAAVGLTALALLYLTKWSCEHMARRQPQRAKLWSTLFSLRFTFTVLLYILVSFLVNRGLSLGESRFRLLGHIPTGFVHMGTPSLDPKLLSAILPDLPAAVIIIIIEHIAIGKSFGQINNYAIVPSQEIVSLAATNILGTFVGAYASTGSFGGSAIYSKAGVRTPLAGVFTACLLALALYALTKVLYFIPMASMAALIIHAVINLVTSPEHLYKSWLISPPDVIIYFIGVFVSIFTSLENGIYVTVALSLALLLLRAARSQGRLMGRLQVHHYPTARREASDSDSQGLLSSSRCSRSAFLPLDRADASNPVVAVKSPRPGIFIYRFAAGFNYLNQAQHVDHILSHVKKETRRTMRTEYEHPGDCPWNEPPPKISNKKLVVPLGPDHPDQELLSKPTLQAVILDFSAVNTSGGLDSGAVEGLLDLRSQLDRWAAPDPVEWHFACVGDRWTRRALAVAGFGYPSKRQFERLADGSNGSALGQWEPVFSLAEKAGLEPREGVVVDELLPRPPPAALDEAEKGNNFRRRRSSSFVYKRSRLAAVYGINRPNFHIDLEAAVEACERALDGRDSKG